MFAVIDVRNEPRLDEESLSEDFPLVAMEEGSDEGGGEERFGNNDSFIQIKLIVTYKGHRVLPLYHAAHHQAHRNKPRLQTLKSSRFCSIAQKTSSLLCKRHFDCYSG